MSAAEITAIADEITRLKACLTKALDQGNLVEYRYFKSRIDIMEIIKPVLQDLETRVSALEP